MKPTFQQWFGYVRVEYLPGEGRVPVAIVGSSARQDPNEFLLWGYEPWGTELQTYRCDWLGTKSRLQQRIVSDAYRPAYRKVAEAMRDPNLIFEAAAKLALSAPEHERFRLWQSDSAA